jgi:hypothetical protein
VPCRSSIQHLGHELKAQDTSYFFRKNAVAGVIGREWRRGPGDCPRLRVVPSLGRLARSLLPVAGTRIVGQASAVKVSVLLGEGRPAVPDLVALVAFEPAAGEPEPRLRWLILPSAPVR